MRGPAPAKRVPLGAGALLLAALISATGEFARSPGAACARLHTAQQEFPPPVGRRPPLPLRALRRASLLPAPRLSGVPTMPREPQLYHRRYFRPGTLHQVCERQQARELRGSPSGAHDSTGCDCPPPCDAAPLLTFCSPPSQRPLRGVLGAVWAEQGGTMQALPRRRVHVRCRPAREGGVSAFGCVPVLSVLAWLAGSACTPAPASGRQARRHGQRRQAATVPPTVPDGTAGRAATATPPFAQSAWQTGRRR